MGEEFRYELRVLSDTDYNGFAEVMFWYFANGVQSATHASSHSVRRKFPSGTLVLCRLKAGKDKDGQPGYFMAGFAEVKQSEANGRPVEFGETLSNSGVDDWQPPDKDTPIFDCRTKGEAKQIQ